MTPSKAKNLKHRYGITLDEYESMLEAQGGVCYICKEVPSNAKGFHVDHCHGSLKVRALLCGNCNVMLAMAKDQPGILIAGAFYLEEHSEDG